MEILRDKDNQIIDPILCNKCGNSLVAGVNPYDDFQGLIDAHFVGGYNSKKWDLTRVSFSMCEDCLEELFSSFKIPHKEEEYMAAHNYINEQYKDLRAFYNEISKSKKENIVTINIAELALSVDDVTNDTIDSLYRPRNEDKYVIYNFDGINSNELNDLFYKCFYKMIKMGLKYNDNYDYKNSIDFKTSDKELKKQLDYIISDAIKTAKTATWFEKRDHYTLDVSEFTLNPIFATKGDFSAEEFINRELSSFLSCYKEITIDFTKCNNVTSEFVEYMISNLYDYLGENMFNKRIKFEKIELIQKTLEKVIREKNE